MNPQDPLRNLTSEQKRRAIRQMRQYLRDHFDLDPGDLGVELLLERMAELVGPSFYNRGLEDARTAIRRRLQEIEADIGELRGNPRGR